MLADAKSKALVDNFAGQWLRLRNISEWQPDPDQFLQFDDAVWVRCEEIGKLGRAVPHIHFLIAAIPKRIDLEKFCHTLKSKWHRVGGGLHKITPYDRGLDGAGYIAKRAGEFNGYSRETFGLMFSPAALARLRRMAERGTV